MKKQRKKTQIGREVVISVDKFDILTLISRAFNIFGMLFIGSDENSIERRLYASPRGAKNNFKEAVKVMKHNGDRIIYKGKPNRG